MDQNCLMLAEGYSLFFDFEPLIMKIKKTKKRTLAFVNMPEHCMTPKIAGIPQWVTNLNNLNFYKIFRMERTTFYIFVNSIRRCDNKNLLNLKYSGGHYPVKDEIQILVFLKYMSSQDTLITIGHTFRLSPATVMNIINKVLYFVLMLKKKYIKFPSTAEEINTVRTNFRRYPGKLQKVKFCSDFSKVLTYLLYPKPEISITD